MKNELLYDIICYNVSQIFDWISFISCERIYDSEDVSTLCRLIEIL